MFRRSAARRKFSSLARVVKQRSWASSNIDPFLVSIECVNELDRINPQRDYPAHPQIGETAARMSDFYEADRISWIGLRAVELPLAGRQRCQVATGRQQPLDAVSLLIVELQTQQGPRGAGVQLQPAYRRTGAIHSCPRAGAAAARRRPQRHCPSVRPAGLGQRLDRPRCGLVLQSIAAFDTALWDLKARGAEGRMWR